MPRALSYLLSEKVLKPNEFALYFHLIALARFDTRNKWIGIVDMKALELTEALNMNYKTINKLLRSLITKEFVCVLKHKYIYIYHYQEWYKVPNLLVKVSNKRQALAILTTKIPSKDTKVADYGHDGSTSDCPNNVTNT
jgi:predicted transcriptional regulator